MSPIPIYADRIANGVGHASGAGQGVRGGACQPTEVENIVIQNEINLSGGRAEPG